MQTKIEKMPKATIKVTVTVENQKVKETYEHVLDEAVQQTNIEGFRVGNAPREMVKEKVGISNLYGDVINHLLQNYYTQALKENHIMPVANPRVEIKEFEMEKDFEFVALVPVRPEVKLGDYKADLKKRQEARETARKTENEEKLKKGEELVSTDVAIGSSEVIEALVATSELDIADLLVDEETDRMMSRLVDQAQSIGLSLEQYLKSQNKTAEQLRADYAKISEKNLKAEFILAQVVQEEKIDIEDKEVDDMINAVGDPKTAERLNTPEERAYIKSMLIKNKLIHQLIEEAKPLSTSKN